MQCVEKQSGSCDVWKLFLQENCQQIYSLVPQYLAIPCQYSAYQSINQLINQSSNMDSISSAGGCLYLYSRHQYIKFLLIHICSINVSLLKSIIPFLSWLPLSSSSFYLSFLQLLYYSLWTHLIHKFSSSHLTPFHLLQHHFLLQHISNLHISHSVHRSLLCYTS